MEAPMSYLPEELLSAIAWDFARPTCENLPSLDLTAASTQLDVLNTTAHWHPWALELAQPVVHIQLGTGRAARVVELRSAFPSGFTTAELLFALHREVQPLAWGLQCLGLRSLTLVDSSGPVPLYVLRLAPILERRVACSACGWAP
jgi:hypothetical protein